MTQREKELEAKVARLERQFETVKPYICTDAKCKERKNGNLCPRYKKVLDLLPTANSEEIKIMADFLYRTIDYLEESIKSLDGTIETLREIIESQDDRLETLREIIESQDDRIETLKEAIDLLENQRKRHEFEKVLLEN